MPAKKSKAVTALDILRYARALLAKRGGWTKVFYARTAKSIGTDATADNACKFCALGAIMRASHDLGIDYGELSHKVYAVNALRQALPVRDQGVISFNDAQTTVKPILAAYDRAIAKLEAQHG
jgi:hypothetical protein